jgi:phage repressor protein C with HTH and peptisase S24 domain
MLKHAEIWQAIDRLAALHGTSVSALAKLAGLDATTFNKSKRVDGEGRKRWPSTESIAKILQATDSSLDDFVNLTRRKDAPSPALRDLPLLAFKDAEKKGAFDEDGHPSQGVWDSFEFPGISDESAFVLEVSGGLGAPLYRDGDMVVVSPNADLRRGDRVVILDTKGKLKLGLFIRKSTRKLDIETLSGQKTDSLEISNILWVARVIWASQ